jgi:hypothetical protein
MSVAFFTTMLTRFSDWQSRFDFFLKQHALRSFHYGTWDCCLFVCGAIHAMTGVDLAAPYRGRYESQVQAYEQILAQTGRKTLSGAVEQITSQFSMRKLETVALAGRGDVILIKRGRDYSLGVVSLNGRQVIVVSSFGLVSIPLARGLRAWRV